MHLHANDKEGQSQLNYKLNYKSMPFLSVNNDLKRRRAAFYRDILMYWQTGQLHVTLSKLTGMIY